MKPEGHVKVPFKRGDFVQVIAGKERGKKAKVISVLRRENRMILEGLNLVRRHQKAKGSNVGSIVDKEAPIHVSNCMIVCASCQKPRRIKRVVDTSGPKRVVKRVCKKCETVLEAKV